MKNAITTKDLLSLNELIIFEQWASTKYRLLHDLAKEGEIKSIFKRLCLEHQARRQALVKYLKSNVKAGEKNA